MSARRAMIDPGSQDREDVTLTAFQQPSAKRAVRMDAVLGSATAATTNRDVASAAGFGAEDTLTATRPLPKFDGEIKPVAARTVKLKRSLLGVAAAVTAGAALIVPSALSTVTAQDSITQATPSAGDRVIQNSRDSARPDLADPVTEAEAKNRADAKARAQAEAARVSEEQARKGADAQAVFAAQAAAAAEAEAARVAAEQAAAAEAARVAAEAEAARVAEQERQAAANAATYNNPAAVNNSGGVAAQSAPAPAVGYCAFGDGSNLGLTYQAQTAFQAICARFPNVSSYGGWRGSADDHGSGQAIDIMISGPAGWDIANWLVANAGTYGVEYVIYEQQIWGRWASGSGFTYMEDRGSATANHYDHVHVTIR